jgi:hypothetical protein
LLTDETDRAERLEKGRAALEPLTGALERTLAALKPYLETEGMKDDAA